MRGVVERLASSGSLARAGITDLEIGYFARSANEWEQGIESLDPFELVETSPITFVGRVRSSVRWRRSISGVEKCRTC